MPTVSSAMRQTSRVSFQSVSTRAAESEPLRVLGGIFARQRISSAIQLPIPGKAVCTSSAPLTASRERLFRNARTSSSVKSGEVTAGGSALHHAGGSAPSAKRTRPKMRGSRKINARFAWNSTR